MPQNIPHVWTLRRISQEMRGLKFSRAVSVLLGARRISQEMRGLKFVNIIFVRVAAQTHLARDAWIEIKGYEDYTQSQLDASRKRCVD